MTKNIARGRQIFTVLVFSRKNGTNSTCIYRICAKRASEKGKIGLVARESDARRPLICQMSVMSEPAAAAAAASIAVRRYGRQTGIWGGSEREETQSGEGNKRVFCMPNSTLKASVAALFLHIGGLSQNQKSCCSSIFILCALAILFRTQGEEDRKKRGGGDAL